MSLSVKVLSRDKCLEIAKIVLGNPRATFPELLNYLPDNVFGRTHKVAFINHGCFEIYVGNGSLDTWSIPAYFVEAPLTGGHAIRI